MASALQQMCDSLLAAVRPVDTAVAELTSRGARLRAAGNRLGALSRSAQDLDLRSASSQLLVAAAALERAAAIASETTRQAQLYVSAMLASGQVRRSSGGAGVESIPIGKVSPEYSRRLRREAWAAIGSAVGREAAWAAGPVIVSEIGDIDLPDSDVFRQAITDLPVAVAALAQAIVRVGKRR